MVLIPTDKHVILCQSLPKNIRKVIICRKNTQYNFSEMYIYTHEMLIALVPPDRDVAGTEKMWCNVLCKFVGMGRGGRLCSTLIRAS